MTSDQHDQQNDERRLAVQRPEFDALGKRVDRIEQVVFGVEQIGLKGMLGRVAAIEHGITEIKDAIEKQQADRERLIFFVRALLATAGGQIGLKIGELMGLWP